MKISPEYLHVLLNPFPLVGLALGAIALCVALGLQSRPAEIVALIILCLSSALAWPVFHYGEKAYDNVMMLTDKDGTGWMDEHQRRAEKAIVGFYIVVAVALAALIVPAKWPRSATPLNLITLVLALLMFGVGAWIGYAGGRIRHGEFRGDTPAPAPKAME